MNIKKVLIVLLCLATISIACVGQSNLEATISANDTQIANLQTTYTLVESNLAIETAFANTLDARASIETGVVQTLTAIAANTQNQISANDTQPSPPNTKLTVPNATTPSNYAGPVGSPTLVLDKNYMCRGGPGKQYKKLWTFLAGERLKILGKSGTGWWLIKIDDPRTRKVKCWIGGGVIQGDSSSIPVSDWVGDGYED